MALGHAWSGITIHFWHNFVSKIVRIIKWAIKTLIAGRVPLLSFCFTFLGWLSCGQHLASVKGSDPLGGETYWLNALEKFCGLRRTTAKTAWQLAARHASQQFCSLVLAPKAAASAKWGACVLISRVIDCCQPIVVLSALLLLIYCLMANVNNLEI